MSGGVGGVLSLQTKEAAVVAQREEGTHHRRTASPDGAGQRRELILLAMLKT